MTNSSTPSATATADSSSIFAEFLAHIDKYAFDLYPAQEEAILEIMSGKNIILSTPTGSGKSLVALAMHFKGLKEGKRSFYTCPIKALVNEKFFNLCKEFGAENVGMLTGDASINREAKIICATAEILANIALAEGEKAAVDYVIMDEFHYYGDKERGVAWQIPLLTLPQATFLLMSATINNDLTLREQLTRLNQREVVYIHNRERPIPLDYTYSENFLHETLTSLIAANKAPIYVVNFTQRECHETAQNILSFDFTDKDQKKLITAALAGFKFDTPFGKELHKFMSHGLGLHHAGLLPKYRLLGERLAKEGLLKIILGTDTLGVGVNIPIRTVLFTKLCKFDGEKVGILKVRDFQQIAGRAGRKGYDLQGSVVCQAPEHVIENKRLEAKASNTAAKKSKIVKKKPPTKNYVPWDEQTFKRLSTSDVENLSSEFQVSHSMLLNILRSTSNTNGYKKLLKLIADSHETPGRKKRHKKHAALLFKSLLTAQIIEIHQSTTKGLKEVRINQELQDDFSLNQSLSLYLHQTLPLLDRETGTYALNILTLVEAILENPLAILQKQKDKLYTAKLHELKAAGIPYEERLQELEDIDYPKPESAFIYSTFNEFAQKHPWLIKENIKPKSIVREMFETYSSFNEYVQEYKIERAEGLLLRHLMQTYKTLIQNVPESYKTPEVYEISTFLHETLRKVDASLLAEWQNLVKQEQAPHLTTQATARETATATLIDQALNYHPAHNYQNFASKIRHDLHQFCKALAKQDYLEALNYLVTDPADLWTAERLEAAFSPYFQDYPYLLTNHEARYNQLTKITATIPLTNYEVIHTLVDPEHDNLWYLKAEVVLPPLSPTNQLAATEPWLALRYLGS